MEMEEKSKNAEWVPKYRDGRGKDGGKCQIDERPAKLKRNSRR